MLIGNRQINVNSPPFMIAEMSGNHNGSLDRALEITEAAAKAGANALKLQTYTAETMTLDVENREFFIDDPGSLWYGRSLYKLYEIAHTPWEWHESIFQRGRELGMIVFSTPFDETAVDFLENLGTPCYKIASFENNHLPLIEKVGSTKKPLLLSTGMATKKEIGEAVKIARGAGCQDLILMKCTSAYPAQPQDANILTIPNMRKSFQCEIGISDHTLGVSVSIAAVACGAVAIEKHFTSSRDQGVDSAFSLEPLEFETLVTETKKAWESLGKVQYGPTESEVASKQFRRSIYTNRRIEAGEALSEDNIRIVRPGFGLAPKYFKEVLGRKVTTDLRPGSPITWEVLLP